MPADPGPFTVLDPSDFDLEVQPLGTLPEELELHAEWDALEQVTGQDLEDLAPAVSTEWIQDWDADALELAGDIGVDRDAGDLSDLEQGALASEEIDGLVLGAYNEIPAQAWQDLPAPFEAPPEEGGFTELPDYAAPTQPGQLVPGEPGTTPATWTSPRVALVNLARAGAREWHVGESWRLEIAGPPNADVGVWASHDGVDLGMTQLGYTDDNGWFFLTGIASEAELGAWREVFYVAYLQCSPGLEFVVYP